MKVIFYQTIERILDQKVYLQQKIQLKFIIDFSHFNFFDVFDFDFHR